ncbi:unnamed protein product [Prorocentrum cordatum]|uniref:Uncharacterized protein n=2 Tax=Prorocentrum cordatum TaxID=2364126 RepID=A0ABN9TYY6_9DINO|nr:unnamed protein product [Polarella glacialis]
MLAAGLVLLVLLPCYVGHVVVCSLAGPVLHLSHHARASLTNANMLVALTMQLLVGYAHLWGVAFLEGCAAGLAGALAPRGAGQEPARAASSNFFVCAVCSHRRFFGSVEQPDGWGTGPLISAPRPAMKVALVHVALHTPLAVVLWHLPARLLDHLLGEALFPLNLASGAPWTGDVLDGPPRPLGRGEGPQPPAAQGLQPPGQGSLFTIEIVQLYVLVLQCLRILDAPRGTARLLTGGLRLVLRRLGGWRPAGGPPAEGPGPAAAGPSAEAPAAAAAAQASLSVPEERPMADGVDVLPGSITSAKLSKQLAELQKKYDTLVGSGTGGSTNNAGGSVSTGSPPEQSESERKEQAIRDNIKQLEQARTAVDKVPNCDEAKAVLDAQLSEARKQLSSLKPELTVHTNIGHRLQRAEAKVEKISAQVSEQIDVLRLAQEKLDSLQSQHLLASKEVEQLRGELVATLPSSVAQKEVGLDMQDLAENDEEKAQLEALFQSSHFKLYQEALSRKAKAKQSSSRAATSPFDQDGAPLRGAHAQIAGRALVLWQLLLAAGTLVGASWLTLLLALAVPVTVGRWLVRYTLVAGSPRASGDFLPLSLGVVMLSMAILAVVKAWEALRAVLAHAARLERRVPWRLLLCAASFVAIAATALVLIPLGLGMLTLRLLLPITPSVYHSPMVFLMTDCWSLGLVLCKVLSRLIHTGTVLHELHEEAVVIWTDAHGSLTGIFFDLRAHGRAWRGVIFPLLETLWCCIWSSRGPPRTRWSGTCCRSTVSGSKRSC